MYLMLLSLKLLCKQCTLLSSVAWVVVVVLSVVSCRYSSFRLLLSMLVEYYLTLSPFDCYLFVEIILLYWPLLLDPEYFMLVAFIYYYTQSKVCTYVHVMHTQLSGFIYWVNALKLVVFKSSSVRSKYWHCFWSCVSSPNAHVRSISLRFLL